MEQKQKTPSLGLTLNLELGPSLEYYVFFIQAFLDIERSLDGAKRKKVELGPSSELGAEPKLCFFFPPSKLLLTPREIQIEQ
jgi:hypothetical protein